MAKQLISMSDPVNLRNSAKNKQAAWSQIKQAESMLNSMGSEPFQLPNLNIFSMKARTTLLTSIKISTRI